MRLEVIYQACTSTPGVNENNAYQVRLGNGMDMAYVGMRRCFTDQSPSRSSRIEDTKTARAAVEWAGREKQLVEWIEHDQPISLGEGEIFDAEPAYEGGYRKRAYARNLATIKIVGEAVPRVLEVTFYHEEVRSGRGMYVRKQFSNGWTVRDTGRIALPADLSEQPAPRMVWRSEEVAQ